MTAAIVAVAAFLKFFLPSEVGADKVGVVAILAFLQALPFLALVGLSLVVSRLGQAIILLLTVGGLVWANVEVRAAAEDDPLAGVLFFVYPLFLTAGVLTAAGVLAVVGMLLRRRPGREGRSI